MSNVITLGGLQEIAVKYLDAGLSVIPTANKIPALKEWKPYQVKPMDQDAAVKLFKGAAEIAILAGAVSGGLEVVDVDVKHDNTGKLWEELREALEDSVPDVFSRLVIAKTRSGGYHLYYRCDVIKGNLKLAVKENKEVIIETRGEGGYVIAPPSKGYEYTQGSPLNIPTITAQEREIVLNIARSFNQAPPEVKVAKVTGGSFTDGSSPWEDYNQRGDVIGLLEAHGWKVVNQRGERINLIRPGDTDSKTSGNYHTGKRLLLVFSSSTEFNPGQGYPPSEVFKILECNGDSKTSYHKLTAMGYGSSGKKTTHQAQSITIHRVNKVSRESLVMCKPGEVFSLADVTEGEELLIDATEKAREEVIKAIHLITRRSRDLFIKVDNEAEFIYYRYLLECLFKDYETAQEEDNGRTDKNINRLVRRVIDLLASIPPTSAEMIRGEFLNHPGVKDLGITPEAVIAEEEVLRKELLRKAQLSAQLELNQEVKELLDAGKPDEALTLQAERIQELRVLNKADLIDNLRRIPSREEFLAGYKIGSDNLVTGYEIDGKPLEIPAGALTGIAAATGHGKTDFLINLALNASLDNPEKRFYFFSYEISYHQVYERMLNAYLDLEIQRYDNIKGIRDYLKTGSTQYILKEAREAVIEGERKFYDEIIKPGRIVIQYCDHLAPDIITAMGKIAPEASGFFLDYIQLLTLPKTGYKNYSRQEELKKICQELKDLAVKIQLPVISAVQFNREVISPYDLHPTNIGEAGDIERVLHLLIGLWKTDKPVPEKAIPSGMRTKYNNEILQYPGHLYANVLKNRGNQCDYAGLIKYDPQRSKLYKK